ncbi:MAG: hypothetical protein EOQ98_17595 [Mesorhizobium sp.]|nr:hypothetical protein [Mesorhizobium sp.]RWO97730.1 MAG: hypothetical protein EOQ98_17595 [Mesorhizobium sp.]
MTLYEAAHPPKVPVVQAGQQIDTGRWFVTLLTARVGTVPPTGVPPSQPVQLLMVDLDVVNRSATPNNVLYRVVTLGAPALKLPMPTAFLDRDKYLAGYFNPNMPERTTMAWEWPAGVPVPDKVTITVTGQIYKLRDNLYGASGWYDRDPVATVDLPVEKAP